MEKEVMDSLPVSAGAETGMTNDTAEVHVYREGPLSLSVCVPSYWKRDRVELEVNKAHHCGTENGWMVSQDKKFSGGQPMPCECDQVAFRRHWLMDC